MKQIKMIFCITLCMLLFFGLAVGCGQDAPVEDNTTAQPEENREEASNNGENENEEDPAEESTWEFTISWADGEALFTIEELKEMQRVTLTAEVKEETNEYTGVILKNLLEKANIKEAAEVTLVAADGYSAALEGDTAFSDNTIIAFKINGEALEDKSAPIMLVTTEASPQVWVGQLKTIKVE
ncbi:molybdopterin-dependent oxidoreductase [Candidatus Contubernalis alkaliaceticus]|uniref:molybdopterin-dependent oxidoreductase n=1 Tax=Candidatus Contubernalis alkaliaceticus TaxID=338645 RepID=UPI001F4C2544|nr:molybdopterin-dependent oxidoreductase [Candidatus Contubernalis alkalaceticus]UNC91958.1 molybdopterin-dependent oxidoreductase [Candidatus Contubernalis alkalaceticus]